MELSSSAMFGPFSQQVDKNIFKTFSVSRKLGHKTNKQTNERTNEQTNERTNERTNEQTNERTNERTNDERTNERTNKQTNERTTKKQRNKETNKQTNNRTNKQTNKQTNQQSNKNHSVRHCSQAQVVSKWKLVRFQSTMPWWNKTNCPLLSKPQPDLIWYGWGQTLQTLFKPCIIWHISPPCVRG